MPRPRDDPSGERLPIGELVPLGSERSRSENDEEPRVAERPRDRTSEGAGLRPREGGWRVEATGGDLELSREAGGRPAEGGRCGEGGQSRGDGVRDADLDLDLSSSDLDLALPRLSSPSSL
jgi:hypothetical protein